VPIHVFYRGQPGGDAAAVKLDHLDQVVEAGVAVSVTLNEPNVGADAVDVMADASATGQQGVDVGAGGGVAPLVHGPGGGIAGQAFVVDLEVNR
jgi:hypothetical protein